jgi:hypothetical protein
MPIKNTTLDDVAAVIGFTATLRLSVWFGNGNNLYVPMEIYDNSLLVKIVGFPAAKRLSENWPGEHLAIPRLDDYTTESRRRLIGRMLEQGFGTREIANSLHMSERRVQQICRQLEVDGLIRPVLARGKVPPEIA